MTETVEKKRESRGDSAKTRLRQGSLRLRSGQVGGQVSQRCGYVMEDGRKCKQKPWLGGEFCFQHDPETAELRKLAGRPSKERLTKGQEVEELLEETLEELRAGRMKPGQAYATGYLAQLMLMARESRRKEVKLDVKWFWDMVDLVLALEDGEKALKEKKAREAREARKAREPGEPQMNPSAPLPSASSGSPLRSDRAGADERGLEEESEEEDDSGEALV